MNKSNYSFFFNNQTAAVVIVAFISAYVSLVTRFSIYIDFLILGIIVVFPLTLTIKEAFKRRERAIKSLCTLKAALNAQFYLFEFVNISPEKKKEFSGMLVDLSGHLTQFLVKNNGDKSSVRWRMESIVRFLRRNNEELKEKHLSKLLSNFEDVNEEVEFLMATKEHHTPGSIRKIVLFAIYVFVVFYPASLLNEKGFDIPLWYLFSMTVFKSVILISLYNTQVLLESTFSQKGADRIGMAEFTFKGWTDPSLETIKGDKEHLMF
jgi:hypothetical protein